MLLKNYSDHILLVPDLGIRCAPGDVCEIEDGYAEPRRAANGSRIPSIIENLAPGLEPVDEAARAAWKQIPGFRSGVTAEKKPSITQLMAQGIPEGVAEVLAARVASEDAKPRTTTKVKTNA